MTTNIEQLVIELSKDSFNPEINFKIALAYEELGQTAGASSSFLRSAEYGFESHPLIAYASLLKLGMSIGSQGDRRFTESNNILQAIALLPTRPEGYFLLSRFYERNQQWQECYTTARMGLVFAEKNLEPLPTDVQYPGAYGLLFEQGVSGWWLGQVSESREIFTYLFNEVEIDDAHRNACLNNLKMIGEKNG
jgi:hypothetical protein